MASMKRERKN